MTWQSRVEKEPQKPYVSLGSLGCDGLQEESDRLAAVLVETGTGLMGGENGAGEQVGRYGSQRQWKIRYLNSTSSRKRKWRVGERDYQRNNEKELYEKAGLKSPDGKG